MTEVNEALHILDSTIQPLQKSDIVSVDACIEQILSDPITARYNEPAFDNSAMDGYVFMRKDLEQGKRRFPVQELIRPEVRDLSPLSPGKCAYITTGSRVPPGGDFVIPVELTKKGKDGSVWVEDVPSKNAIRRQGEGYKRGETLLLAGKRIHAADIGVMQLNGYKKISVKRKIRIAIQATGSELDAKKNTNTPVLKHLLGGDPSVKLLTPDPVEDDKTAMEQRFRELLGQADLLITTGGISAGAFDYVIPVLESLGANFSIRKVSQKPGKPFSFGKRGNTCLFCLPGNPVSAFFCAVLYVKRALKLMRDGTRPPATFALLQNEYTSGKNRTEFVPGRLFTDGVTQKVSVDEGIRSHLLHRLSEANCFVRIEPASTLSSGETVEVIPFGLR